MVALVLLGGGGLEKGWRIEQSLYCASVSWHRSVGTPVRPTVPSRWRLSAISCRPHGGGWGLMARHTPRSLARSPPTYLLRSRPDSVCVGVVHRLAFIFLSPHQLWAPGYFLSEGSTLNRRGFVEKWWLDDFSTGTAEPISNCCASLLKNIPRHS